MLLMLNEEQVIQMQEFKMLIEIEEDWYNVNLIYFGCLLCPIHTLWMKWIS